MLLVLLCTGLVGAPLLASLVGMAQKYLATEVGERVMLDLRQQLFTHLHRLPLRYFEARHPGDFITRLNSVDQVKAFASDGMVRSLADTSHRQT